MELHPANSDSIIKEILPDDTTAKVWKAISDKDEMKQWSSFSNCS